MRVYGFGLVVFGLLFFLAGAARGDDQADVRPILDKAARALGGEDRLAKLKIGAAKGKFTIQQGDQTLTADLEVYWNGLDRHRADMDQQVNGMSIHIILVRNGDKAWIN